MLSWVYYCSTSCELVHIFVPNDIQIILFYFIYQARFFNLLIITKHLTKTKCIASCVRKFTINTKLTLRWSLNIHFSVLGITSTTSIPVKYPYFTDTELFTLDYIFLLAKFHLYRIMSLTNKAPSFICIARN